MKKAANRTLEALRQCKPPPSPIFTFVDCAGDNCGNWSQNLITSSWGTPLRSRKFHQNPFMTFRVGPLSLILLKTHKQMPLNITWWRLCMVGDELFAGLIRFELSNHYSCVRTQNACKMHHSEAKKTKFWGWGTATSHAPPPLGRWTPPPKPHHTPQTPPSLYSRDLAPQTKFLDPPVIISSWSRWSRLQLLSRWHQSVRHWRPRREGTT